MTQFNTIDALLGAVSTDIERIRVLASPSQDSVVGIIDYPDVAATDSDKAYWEGNYQVLDAVVAIYDLISGRDTNFTTAYADVIHTDPSDGVCIGASAGHIADHVFTVLGDGYFTDLNAANITLRGDGIVTSKYAVIDYIIISDNLVATGQGIGIEEGWVTSKLTQTALWLQEKYGDMRFIRPWALSDYQAMNDQCGGWRFLLGATQIAAFSLTGSFWIGSSYPSNDETLIDASFVAQVTDLDNAQFMGFSTDLGHPYFDTRLICSYSAGDPVEIRLRSYKSGSDKIAFEFDSVEVAYINQSGVLYLDSAISCVGVLSTGDVVGVAGTFSGEVSADSFTTGGDLQVDNLIALGAVYAGSYASAPYAKLDDGSGIPSMSLYNTNGEWAIVKHEDASITSKLKLLNDNGVVIDTITAAQKLLILADSTDYRAGIRMGDTYDTDYFFCQDGVLKTSDSIGSGTNAFGKATNVGVHKVPYFNCTVTFTDFIARVSSHSESVEGAIVLAEDGAASRRIYCYIDGGWRYATLVG